VIVHPDQQDWAEKIPMVEFTLNSTISTSSGFTPFELSYGYIPSINPRIIPELSAVPSVKYFVARALRNLSHEHNVIIES